MARHLEPVTGLILAGSPRGEASRLFLIFTRERGLLRATARSVRRGDSKLRGHLQVGRLVKMDLVRGREWWHVVGVGESEQILIGLPAGTGQFIALLAKLLPPEEPNPEIFDDLVHGLELFSPSADPADLETLLVLRLLFNLGYLDPAAWQEFVGEIKLTLGLVERFSSRRDEAVQVINQSLAVL